MSTGQTFNLRILQETFFKVSTASSSTLNDRQKVRLVAGQTFSIRKYQSNSGHFEVELVNPIAPVGATGYLFEPHVQITPASATSQTVGSIHDVADPPPGFSLLWIAQNTKIKTSPESSSNLRSHQQMDLAAGRSFLILGYASVADHFRVTLNQPLENFGRIGYLYNLHVQIKRDGKLIAFDPNALNLVLLRNTVIKKQPIDSSQLKPEEQYTLAVGMIYGVSSYVMEAGQLKVSLTENLPPFGNTGYLSPDFVELRRGNTVVNAAPRLNYTGPSAVVANRATNLTGTYDPRVMTKVELIAEDKHPLTVSLNSSARTWAVSLPNGFSTPGARWLRLRGSDRTGKVLDSQIVNITVSPAGTSPQALRLRVTRDTLFKASPVDSTTLNNRQKVMVKTGQTFAVSQYGLVDGHLRVTLDPPIAPIGDFGYFYEGHVQMSKGQEVLRFDLADVPEIPGTAQLLVTSTTFIKSRPDDSANLAANQKAELKLGQSFNLTGYASTSGHFRVTLTESIPGFGRVGFLYHLHVQIKKDGQTVPYDPDALTMTIRQATDFKRRAVPASTLSASDKLSLPVGRIYGVSSYSIEAGNIKVSLTENFANFGNTGYVWPGHVTMRRGSQVFDPLPKQIELNVPYFSQRDNPRFYWSTCNVTSIAMVMYYYGERSQWGGQLEDELLQWCFNRYGEGCQTDHTVLAELIRAYGYKHSFSTTRRWSDVDNELINRRPVVIAGDFTATGHIATIIGYNTQGYILNDPWGDALTGYSYTEGRRLLYPYGYMDRVCGPDGNVWAHFIST
ncbi:MULTISPECIES: C39 family peptidase [Planktothricoides]|uniref:C39 family peptidase n=1 Tax=Planktothricoides raciborskii GIHE-MW2 TaxID=2792601 RepID=A0AAU8JIE3_9CYAN|nr:C39 family peptidase [Planktothricoides sp. SR001]KOR36218.1 peptidoglycan-binding protein [Planktothricoides sp. SR001]